MKADSDTIAAIATAPGEGAISVVRVSGPGSLEIADRIFRCRGPLPSQRAGGSFVYGYVIHEGTVADEGLLLIYRAPRSYTREDSIEIQGHGGSAASQRILRAILDAGARPANPGEFTQRAFLNGRIDLLQAEAVLDLIRARSDRAAAAALDQMEGRLSRIFGLMYDRLLRLAAEMEATLDFGDEELPPTILQDVALRLQAVEQEMALVLSTWGEGHLLREGALVVIGGKPNVGKSTLLNSLLGTQRAIVNQVPGTTRDTIEEHMVIDGYPVRIVDTAGLRDTDCEVEGEGIRRARHSIQKADILIYMMDASGEVDEEDLAALRAKDEGHTIILANKSDLAISESIRSYMTKTTVIACSLVRNEGIAEIKQRIADQLKSQSSSIHHSAISERHRKILVLAIKDIQEALLILRDKDAEIPLASSHIRSALEHLGEANGRVYHEELLQNIFSRFCIGK